MTTRRHYIISYDVASTKEGDKRRSKVFDHLEGRGDRAQFSVFFCALNPRELAQLRMDLDAIIHHGEDQVYRRPRPGTQPAGRWDRMPRQVLRRPASRVCGVAVQHPRGLRAQMVSAN